MNTTQFYISVAVMPITTIIIVLIGVLLNNSNMNARINDLKDLFRAEIAKTASELLAKFVELDNRIDAVTARLDAMTARLDSVTARLDRIEGRLNLR